MQFRLFGENKRFSSKQLQSFLHKLSITEDAAVSTAPKVLFLIPPGCSKRTDFLAQFHREYFDWHPTIKPLYIESHDNSDIEHNLPRTVVSFLPRLKSANWRLFFLINKMEMVAVPLAILLLFGLYFFFSNMLHSGEPLSTYFKTVDWKLFILDNILYNVQYWGPTILMWGLIRKVLSKRAAQQDADEVVQQILRKLRATKYDRVTQGLLDRANGLPFVLYIQDLDELTAEDRTILFENVLRSTRLLTSSTQHFLIAFSSRPGEARSQFMDANDAGEFHIFEILWDDKDQQPEDFQSAEIDDLIRAFYLEYHSDDNSPVSWSFLETFYFYGMSCRLMGDRSFPRFEESVLTYWAARPSTSSLITYLQTSPTTTNIHASLRRSCDDFSLHLHAPKIIPQLMIYKDGRHHIDWYTLRRLKHQIPKPLWIACNVLLLDYYAYWLSSSKFSHISVADSQYITVSLIDEIMEVIAGDSPDASLLQMIQQSCEHYLELFDNAGCDNYSVPICLLLLHCLSKTGLREISAIHFKALHNVIVFEPTNSSQFTKFRQRMDSETAVGQLITAAISKHSRFAADEGQNANQRPGKSSSDQPQNHFRAWRTLSHFEYAVLLPSLPLMFIDDEGRQRMQLKGIDSEYKKELNIDVFQTGGGLYFATWVRMLQMRICLYRGRYSDMLAIFDNVTANIANIRRNNAGSSIKVKWATCLNLFLIIEVYEAIFRLNQCRNVPETWSEESVAALNSAFANIGVKSALHPGIDIPQDLSDRILTRLNEYKVIFELREMPFFSLILEYYRGRFLFLLCRPGSRLLLKSSPRPDDKGLMEIIIKSYLTLYAIKTERDLDYAIWPSFYYHVLVVRASLEASVHCEVSYETLGLYFKLITLIPEIEHHHIETMKLWFFHQLRLYASRRTDFFLNFLRDLCRDLIEKLKSINTVAQLSAAVSEALTIVVDLKRERMLSEMQEINNLVSEAFKQLESGQLEVAVNDDDSLNMSETELKDLLMIWQERLAERGTDSGEFKKDGDSTVELHCLQILNEWILYSEGNMGYPPTVPLEELLENDIFAGSSNYGVAISLYLDRGDIDLDLVKYVKKFAVISMTGFTSMVWSNIFHGIARRLIRVGENVRTDRRNDMPDDLALNELVLVLRDVSEKMWLNYVDLERFSAAVSTVFGHYYKRSSAGVRRERESDDQSLFLHAYLSQVLKKIDVYRVRKLHFQNLRSNITANEYRIICFELFQIFGRYLSLSKDISYLLEQWRSASQASKSSINSLSNASLNIIVDKFKRDSEDLYEVVPLLDEVEQACAQRIYDDSVNKRVMKSCLDLWNLLGYLITENLFTRIMKEQSIGNNTIRELGEFYDFLAGTSAGLSEKERLRMVDELESQWGRDTKGESA